MTHLSESIANYRSPHRNVIHYVPSRVAQEVLEQYILPSMATPKTLRIDNARENNLKDLTFEVPHDELIGITGLSGSGKSSLAFDTIYAEGQRRYIETFSPYTRQFFDKVKRPKVDLIENVRPALAIQQRTRILNSRSTVGSMTDINDYLKIIWSNLSTPVCSECGNSLDYWNAATVSTRIQRWTTLKPDTTYLIGALVANKKENLERLSTLGFSRYYDLTSGELRFLEENPPPKKVKEFLLVIDRVRAGSLEPKRLLESLEQAFSLESRCAIVIEQKQKSLRPFLRVSSKGETSKPSLYAEIFRFWIGYQCGDGEVKVEPPRPSLFSFNHPIGACPECNGFGKILVVDPNKCIPDHSKSIAKGAIECWKGDSSAWEQKHLILFCKEKGIPLDKPWSQLSKEDRELIFNHKSKKYVGIFPWFQYLEQKKYKMHVRVFLARYRGQVDCPRCNGTRLKKDALAYRLNGLSVTEAWNLPLAKLLLWTKNEQKLLSQRKNAPRQLKDVFESVIGRLQYLVDLGLPYLTLDRQSRTLSGGETQRVNLVSAIGSGLVSSQFVLDEPSVGLHPRDSDQLIKALRDLTDRGNSVTMVEHDPDCLYAADSIIELGPHAGAHGGEIVYNGPREGWQGLRMHPFKPSDAPLSTEQFLRVRSARNRNLKSINLDIPLESFVCLTGVSGSGKSSLLTEVIEASYQLYKGVIPPEVTVLGSVTGFEHVSDVLLIDQSPLAKSPRANIATYTKVWDRIRECLAGTEGAITRKLTKSSFSFNVNAGRCPVCEGAGFIREDMQFLSDVFVECEACLGKRFQAAVLEVTYKGKSVHDFLQMTVEECKDFFSAEHHIYAVTSLLSQLGLGHATLGHPLSELSGGEAQRLKLIPHIIEGQRQRSLFLFDEPTTGLHVRDVEKLLELFEFLKSKGHSVICVEHNLRVMAAADWIIDLGPAGGDGGGEVVKEGIPANFVKSVKGNNGHDSLTARYLSDFCKEFGSGAAKPSKKENKKLNKGRKDFAIHIKGAREHNLQDISLSIPLNSFITLTGVSGSGKSTIAKDILYAEGQRRYLDCLSPYARQFIKELKKPDIDDIENVQPTICVYQHTFQPSALSTVGTMSEVYNFLRLLFAKVGVQYCPDHPEESISPLSAENIAHLIKSSSKGVVRLLAPVIKLKKGNHRAVLQRAIDTEISEVRVDGRINSASTFLDEGLAKTKTHSIEFVVAKFNPKNLPYDLVLESVQHTLTIGGGDVVVLGDGEERVFSSQRTCPKCQRGFFKPDPEDLSFHSRRGRCPDCDGSGVVNNSVCKGCNGSRLHEIGRNIRLLEKNIFELSQKNPVQLLKDLEQIGREETTREITEPITKELKGKLSTLVHLGLDYVALSRDCVTLSNGELQRLRLATAIGSPLSGVTYIFDEPSAGLHPADNKRLLSKLLDLKDRGNTVLQIEHELDSILRSEVLIDIGPGAGKHGGRVVFQGSVAEALADAQSPTGLALRTPLEVNEKIFSIDSSLPMLNVRQATKNNLKNICVDIPLQRLVTIAGVSGAGKTSLVHGVIVDSLSTGKGSKNSWKSKFGGVTSSPDIERLLLIDQKPIGKTSRSTPASYLGMWDEIRKIYASTLEAKSRGWTASFFSHNTGKGRCPTCKGNGELTLEMSFLAEAKVLCESCFGSRFTPEADTVKYKDLAVSEVLKLTFEEAKSFFVNHRKIHQICRLACDLGLGYLSLGQPSSTMSGGEAQRLKLVAELHVERRGHSLYILDEPTTGLHRTDVALLLKGLRALVTQGHSVLLIEHDADTVSQSDWVIELGPGPGEKGGTVIFEGVPSDLSLKDTPWGEAIRERQELHASFQKKAKVIRQKEPGESTRACSE